MYILASDTVPHLLTLRYNVGTMDTSQITEYAVHLSHYAVNGIEGWKAVVESLSQIRAEGPTCEAVLEEIGDKLQSSLANAGDDALALPGIRSGADELSPSQLAELEVRLNAMGHAGYGIFAEDPGALEVFDEIERLRDKHTIGGG